MPTLIARVGVAVAAAAAVLVGTAGTALAATATFVTSGLTAPAGAVWLPGPTGTPGHLWVSDHLMGFCRVDGTSLTNCQPLGSAGQPAFDASRNLLYVPDDSSKSVGIARLTYDPASETFLNTEAIASKLAGDRPVGAALGPDGNLYVSFLKNGNIVRVTNPAGAATTNSAGQSSDGRRVSSLAFAGNDLYLAEGAQVGRIRTITATSCTGGCKATTAGLTVSTPLSVAVDPATSHLYIGHLTGVARANVSATGASGQVSYATTGSYPGGSTPLDAVSALAIAPTGDLYLGDDPSQGAQNLTGRLWAIPAGSAPEAAGGGAPPPPPPPPPAPVAAPLTTATFVTSGLTAPAGAVWLPGPTGTPGHLWVADHLMGFCRVDGTSLTNCQPVGSAGQPAFDASRNLLYVPDNASKSTGVLRLTYDPASETFTTAEAIAPSLAGNRPVGAALGPDGNLYVSFLKNGNIVRVTNPAGAATTNSAGQSSDGRRVSSLAFAGADLYLAEGAQVGRIRTITATSCTGGCKATTAGLTVSTPLSVAVDPATSHLYIGHLTGVARANVSATGASGQVSYATTGSYPGGSTPLDAVSALAIAPTGDLYLGDDPSQGAQNLTGRLWKAPLLP